jgi:hypothetical protein
MEIGISSESKARIIPELKGQCKRIVKGSDLLWGVDAFYRAMIDC